MASMREGRDWLDGSLGRALPVLVIWGRQDRLIPVADATRLQAEFPRAQLEVLDGCGHVPMADCPEAFDGVTLRFLADGPPCNSRPHEQDSSLAGQETRIRRERSRRFHMASIDW